MQKGKELKQGDSKQARVTHLVVFLEGGRMLGFAGAELLGKGALSPHSHLRLASPPPGPGMHGTHQSSSFPKQTRDSRVGFGLQAAPK